MVRAKLEIFLEAEDPNTGPAGKPKDAPTL